MRKTSPGSRLGAGPRYGRFYGMTLGGGHFELDPETVGRLQSARKAGPTTVQFLLTPSESGDGVIYNDESVVAHVSKGELT